MYGVDFASNHAQKLLRIDGDSGPADRDTGARSLALGAVHSGQGPLGKDLSWRS